MGWISNPGVGTFWKRNIGNKQTFPPSQFCFHSIGHTWLSKLLIKPKFPDTKRQLFTLLKTVKSLILVENPRKLQACRWSALTIYIVRLKPHQDALMDWLPTTLYINSESDSYSFSGVAQGDASFPPAHHWGWSCSYSFTSQLVRIISWECVVLSLQSDPQRSNCNTRNVHIICILLKCLLLKYWNKVQKETMKCLDLFEF